MFQHDRLSNEITLFQKIKNLDYIRKVMPKFYVKESHKNH